MVQMSRRRGESIPKATNSVLPGRTWRPGDLALRIARVSEPPQPPSGTPPAYDYGPPAPPYHPRAITTLVLGILGVTLFWPLGPFALVMGRRALKEIDSSGGTIGGRGLVLAGYICGILSTVALVLIVVTMVVVADAVFLVVTLHHGHVVMRLHPAY